ncbi:serine protease [Bradyrhizobium diazoefficiens]|uniref:serine protease n=1 Tax=Bradyrhizobium diazoefficiens TaxID=1355477 RepID=UPI000A0764A6|nr:serine protease [Bradyrhizobium diazoefficiens]
MINVRCLYSISVAVLAGLAVARAAADDSPGGRRIVNGNPTEISRHPWQVALNINGPDGKVYLCGGSLVNQRWVLTAAHCFPTTTASDVRVKFGVTDYVGEGSWQSVDRVIIHPEYKTALHENDIAMVRLRVAISGNLADTIPLARADQPMDGSRLEVTGWGATSEGGTVSTILQVAEVPYVGLQDCNAPAAYNGTIVDTMVCAGEKEGGVDSCQGDSGGPLVLRQGSGPILVGVVAYGEGCARKLKYGVYTRVGAYRDWIGSNINAN